MMATRFRKRMGSHKRVAAGMRQHGTGRGRTEPIHMTGWTRTVRFPRQACRNERGAQGGSAVPLLPF